MPHVTQFDEADITELEETRARLKERGGGAGHQAHAARVRDACLREGAAGSFRTSRRRSMQPAASS